jgi:hypothetical protein
MRGWTRKRLILDEKSILKSNFCVREVKYIVQWDVTVVNGISGLDSYIIHIQYIIDKFTHELHNFTVDETLLISW